MGTRKDFMRCERIRLKFDFANLATVLLRKVENKLDFNSREFVIRLK
jgi:hypothetical protein